MIAALLHDVVEDTEYSLEEIESHFGATIRYIVNGLTKGIKQQDQNKVLYEAINFKNYYYPLNMIYVLALLKL